VPCAFHSRVTHDNEQYVGNEYSEKLSKCVYKFFETELFLNRAIVKPIKLTNGIALSSTADNVTASMLGADKKPVNWLSSWHAIVTVSGITFGCLVVVMVFAFLCYHRVVGGRSSPTVGPGRRPRKTHAGQLLVRPLVNGDGLSRDGSATFCDDGGGSPTRSFLLAAYRTGKAPGGRRSRDSSLQYGPKGRREPIDGKFLESDVDSVYCHPASYKIYGFPCATYSGPPTGEPAADGGTCAPFSCHQLMYEQPMCHPYRAAACVNCSLRRSQSPTCSGCSAPFIASVPIGPEVFVDGPPVALYRLPAESREPTSATNAASGDQKSGGRTGGGDKRRPPVDGSDSEMTPVMTRVKPTNAAANEGFTSEACRPQSRDLSSSVVRCRDTSDRPDGQSPSETVEPESLACSTPSIIRRLGASNGALSDMTVGDDLEYDDDIPPSLPGSYFNMDPNAYTLTWSKRPPSKNASRARRSTGSDLVATSDDVR
jgi:hypothetical protein